MAILGMSTRVWFDPVVEQRIHRNTRGVPTEENPVPVTLDWEYNESTSRLSDGVSRHPLEFRRTEEESYEAIDSYRDPPPAPKKKRIRLRPPQFQSSSDSSSDDDSVPPSIDDSTFDDGISADADDTVVDVPSPITKRKKKKQSTGPVRRSLRLIEKNKKQSADSTLGSVYIGGRRRSTRLTK